MASPAITFPFFYRSACCNLGFVHKVDPDEVVRLWVDEYLNVTEIAAKVGVTHQRVSAILREREIDRGPKRFRHKPKTIDPDLLRKLYVDQRLPAYVIAQQMKVGSKTVMPGWTSAGSLGEPPVRRT